MKAYQLLRLLPALLLPPTLLLAQGGAYTVQGQLGPNTRASKAYLTYKTSSGGYQFDSTAVQRGRFVFAGRVAAPVQATLQLPPPGTICRLHQLTPAFTQASTLYVEPGTIRVISPDSLLNAVLSGTPLNVDQNRLAQLVRPTQAQMQAIENEWKTAPAAKQQDKAYEAELDKRAAAVYAAEEPLRVQFMQQNPASLVSLDILKYHTLDPAEMGPLFDKLAPAVRNSVAGREYATKLAKARQLAIGALAPEFTQNDPSGKPVKLSDFRGKYVLLDFWASWCVPCREENPNVLANYTKYKAQNFTVLAVSVDEAKAREAWLKAIETDKLPWPQVSDLKGWKNVAAQLYGIRFVPSNLLIGPDGRILAKDLRGQELGQKLAAVLPAASAQ